MPQPLSNYFPDGKAGLRIAPDAICNEQPELALQMMGVICHWAFIEGGLGTTLGTIMGTDAVAVTEELTILATSSAHADYLLKQAHKRLPADELEALSVLLDMFGSTAAERHKLVHWWSGICPQLKNEIILVNPKDFWKAHAPYHEYLARVQEEVAHMRDNPAATWSQTPSPPNLIPSFKKIMVYTSGDFERMHRDINELHNGFFSLHWIVGGMHDKAQEFQRLQRLPRFRQGIERVRTRPNSAPPKRARLSRVVRALLSRLRRLLK